MKPQIKWALLVGVGFFAVNHASANLVVNGSFESGSFTDNTGQDTDNLAAGSTAMTGWSVTTASLAWIGPNNPFGLTAAKGSYFLDLTGYHDNVPYAGVASTTFTTSAGQMYNVSFELGTAPIYNTLAPSIQVTVGSGSPQTFTASTIQIANNWQTFSFDFKAAGASTSLSFLGTGPGNQKYIGLDNVIVSAVPEPTTMVAGALLLLPFGMSTLRALRKDRTA